TNPLPLFSLEINRRPTSTADAWFVENVQNRLLEVRFGAFWKFTDGVGGKLTFKNISHQEILLNNIVPFGTGGDHFYISSKSAADTSRIVEPAETSSIPKLFNPFTNSPDTSRSFLFRPGYAPVGVVVPHNNQDLGFCTVELNREKSLYGLVRRASDTIQNYLLIRTPVRLQPEQEVQFYFFADVTKGGWHEALKECFQERKLYELSLLVCGISPALDYWSKGSPWRLRPVDDDLYKREDLAWIRHAYTLHLMYAWDKNFFDPAQGGYQLESFLLKMKKLYGGDDAFILWPTWPALGMDARKQWELMADLPGGLAQQRRLAEMARSLGTKFFISYNPWDDPNEAAGLAKMAEMIAAVSADGVVLDTKAEASETMQLLADFARPGVVLYSEGMAAPKDMGGILAGRVHNDIYHVPLLNLNKLIKPDFAIFRVAEVARERIRREFALAFFNGHGVEINTMRPGRPAWIQDDLHFWGRCVRILKDCPGAFQNQGFGMVPLLPTTQDSIFVNGWGNGRKMIYTIFNQRSQGFHGALFDLPINPPGNDKWHFVDLWNHEDLEISNLAERQVAIVNLESFNPKYLGTNNEGTVGCIGAMVKLQKVRLESGRLIFPSQGGYDLTVRLLEGDPDWEKTPLAFVSPKKDTAIWLFEAFGRIGGKYVVQFFENGDLLDEQILRIPPGTPVLISKTKSTM
ncbi:MAG: hypothetical protein AAB316_10325, partial [Bacteroidota bacterium]